MLGLELNLFNFRSDLCQPLSATQASIVDGYTLNILKFDDVINLVLE